MQIYINSRYYSHISHLMDAEGETNTTTNKLHQSIEKASELLNTNKHYEFAQKIKSLALRKAQTNKLQESETLLKLGIRKMIDQEIVDYKAVHDLIINLLELYQKNKEVLWKENHSKQLYSLLTLKPNDKNIQYFSRILKRLSTFQQAPQIVDFIISYFESHNLFYRAEELIVHMDLSRVMIFLEKWHEKVSEEEFTIILCRMALLKGLMYDFDEPMVLLSEQESQNPFVKFVRFLILSVQMNSREGYEKIGVGYKKFLGSDDFFSSIYEAYGTKYFNKGKAGSGLLNLLD